MKQLFIGLLIIAAGAGAYYLLQKKKTNTPIIDKELILGQWKMDSVLILSDDSSFLMGRITSPRDSSHRNYQVRFNTGGTFILDQGDSARADTSYYEWNKKSDLVIKDSKQDTTGQVYAINKLNIDSLVLQSKDSIVIMLTKLK